MYYCYVLKSVTEETYYKGLTTDLNRRLKEHATGRNQTTRNMLPVKLVHVEICNTLSDARIMEKIFKSGYGREIISQINQ